MTRQATNITGLLLIAFSFTSLLTGQTIVQTVSRSEPIAETTWDFETDLDGWAKTGIAFDNQPFDGTTVQTNAQQFEKIGGDYWKGIPYPLGQNGKKLILTSDASTGTLTSDPFTLSASTSFLSFLIGGTSDARHERLELQVLSTSRSDAREIERQAREWMRTRPRPGLQWLSIRDADYVTFLAATGINGPDHTLLDLLRQESIQIPQDLFGRTARLRIVDDSETGHINVDLIQLTAKAPPRLKAPAFGYADYHTHLMSNLAFGALKGVSTLWGCPGGNYKTYEKDKNRIERDIPKCILNHGGDIGAEIFINSAEHRINLDHGLFKGFLDFVQFKVLHHDRYGAPSFRSFPSFLSGTHQQMHITQIRRNYEGGLRLLVALAVHNLGAEYFASKARLGVGIDPSTERDVMSAQVLAIRELVELNKDWMEVAFSPDEARDIIRRNKLAIVIGAELDRLGELYPSARKDRQGAQEEITRLWDLGIRALIPVHAVDNWLGGSAVFFDTYNGLNDFLNRHDANNAHLYNIRKEDLDKVKPEFFQVREGCETNELGKCVLFKLKNTQNRLALFHLDLLNKDLPLIEEVKAPYADCEFKGHKNAYGLTEYGGIYVDELMKRGIILDIAHMSEKSVADTFALVQPKGLPCDGFPAGNASPDCYEKAYPTIVSHIFFRSQALFKESTTVKDFLPSEYQLSDSDVEIVRRVGGVVGPMVWQLPLHVEGVQEPAPFKNDCAMSSKGFGYAFRYALEKMKGVGVGMSTDFTFIPGAGPRFGNDACYAYKLAKDPAEEKGLNPGLYDTENQDYGVKYEGWVSPNVQVGNNVPIKPYRMGRRKNPFDFNVDGLAHFGMVPDMLQDLKNVDMPEKDFASLFSSAEAYIQMWEKTWRVAGCDRSNSKCQSKPAPIAAPQHYTCPFPMRH